MADGFADKETAWNNALGKKVGDYCVALVNADSLAKDAQIERTMDLLAKDNVDMSVSVGIIGMDNPLEVGVSTPPITLVDNTPIVIDDTHLKMSLDVHEMASNTTVTKVSSDTEAGANFGFFGQGGSVKEVFHAGVDNTRKRTSDYTSTMEVEVHMKQAAPPETLMVYVNWLTDVCKSAMSINQELIARQGAVLQGEVSKVDKLPEADNG